MDLSPYFDGVVRLPLSQFTSQNTEGRYEIIVPNLSWILQDPQRQIEGRVRPKTRDKILLGLKSTPRQWRSMTPILAPLEANLRQELCCIADSASISSAKAKLGDEFVCTISVYCIPPVKPIRIIDGEVFQNVRYYMKDGRDAVAQEWMDKLSKPKRHHLSLMFGRPAIMRAMDQLLYFPGLWLDLQLGNWAKHLAAHMDEFIINYLSHIYYVYSGIMTGLEDLRDQLDEVTVGQLQYRSPRWCSNDKAFIEEGFDNGTLFPGIISQDIRAQLKNRLISFTGVLPTIKTFHENMKYLTIGAKILEKFIEIKPPLSSGEKDNVYRTRPSLHDNLSADWKLDAMKIQVATEEFISVSIGPNPRLCFIQLLIAAVRYFAYLCYTEAPLMDPDKQVMGASVDSRCQGLICWTALQLGYNNSKITQGMANKPPDIQSYLSSAALERQKPYFWRGGKPPRQVFLFLEHRSFLPNFIPALRLQSANPSPLCIQGDLFGGFFNWREDLLSIEQSMNVKNVTELVQMEIDESQPPPQPPSQKQQRTVGARQKPRQQTRQSNITPIRKLTPQRKSGMPEFTPKLISQIQKTAPRASALSSEMAIDSDNGEGSSIRAPTDLIIPARDSTVWPVFPHSTDVQYLAPATLSSEQGASMSQDSQQVSATIATPTRLGYMHDGPLPEVGGSSRTPPPNIDFVDDIE